jgi:hypothetical protein
MPWQLLIAPITKLIERIFPDKEAQDKAKAEMMTIMASSEAKQLEAKASVVVAEAKGESWMQRNWRPMTMMIFNAILVFNFLLVPILGMFGLVVNSLPIPNDMWLLLSIGIGGYIGSRGYEKVAKLKASHYDVIRKHYGHVSQELVDELENKK